MHMARFAVCHFSYRLGDAKKGTRKTSLCKVCKETGTMLIIGGRGFERWKGFRCCKRGGGFHR